MRHIRDSLERAALHAMLVGFALSIACGRPEPTQAVPAESASAPTYTKLARFRDASLVITRLEQPVTAVVAGTASSETLQSDDPAVVSVNIDGSLTGHRAGKTVIRSVPTPTSTLEVEVRPVRSLRIVPSRLSLQPASAAEIKLFGDEQSLPVPGVEWRSSDPAIATVRGAFVYSGPRTGVAHLVARAGSAEAKLDVAVGEINGLLAVHAPSALPVGAVRRIEVTPQAAAEADWSSSKPAVLRPLGRGFFYAVARGRAKACVSFSRQRKCAMIEVTP